MISFEEHVVTYLRQEVQVSMSWLYIMSVIISSKMSLIQCCLCYSSKIRLAILFAMCIPHICAHGDDNIQSFLAPFPLLFKLFNVRIKFQRKCERWRDIVLCREAEAWHYVAFSQPVCNFLVELGAGLELLVPGCLL